MIYKEGLIKKNIKNIIKSNWYNQRFDGSPQFLGMCTFPHFLRSKRRPKGTQLTDLFGIYTNGIADWYINMRDIKRITRVFINKSKKERNIGRKLVLKWKQDEEDFYHKCHEIGKLKIGSLSNKEILKHYQELLSIYQGWFSMSSIIDGFALGSDAYIYKAVDDFLKSKGIEKGRGKIFSKLTAPVALSFSKEAEISLLKIANKIKNINELRRLVEETPNKKIKNKIKVDYPKIYKLLEKYQQNFFWLKNNYIHCEVINIDEFIVEIKDLLKGNVKKRLDKIRSQLSQNQKEKKKIIQDFNFPLNIRNLIEISESFTTWQDKRKKSTFFAIHYLSLLLEELAKGSEYSLEDFKFFMPDEIIHLVKKNGYYPDKKEIKDRKSYSAFYHRGRSYEYYLGDKARKLFKRVANKRIEKRVNDFRGLTASPGIITGKVRIIKTVQDVHKVKTGDIIVAVMTRPDYMSGIKKASAIVTDEGGVTCHAAIVSREFGIPCVIATKNATQILKDGDLIEVDADHGVVKIINKK